MPSSEVVLPTLPTKPNPVSADALAELYGDGPRIGLIFAAEPELFQSTVHQLQMDAGSAAVLGVHACWRTDDRRHARQALVVEADGLVSRVGFDAPLAMDAAWILHLPLDGERDLHAALSADCHRAGLLQINPYDASRRADDKIRSHQLWTAHLHGGGNEFALPAATVVPQGASAPEAAAIVRRFVGSLDLPGTIVAQPNLGTEGRDAAPLRLERGAVDSLAAEHPVVQHLRDAILPVDDALIREERGNVRTTDLRRIVFRLNVAWDGSDFVAESGFAQVAPDPDAVIASRGRGGVIADINACLADLCYRADDAWRRLVPSEGDVRALKRAACCAARALNAGLSADDALKHMGIDVVLEVDADSGKITPVLLEANARPAGLNQSVLIRGVAPGPSRLHVTGALFDYIRRRAPG